ncbi:nucleotidyl transferase AbiEii/AbiGii toxin family protein [candidate division WWE3 bacterium]|nr:nucleotidyl transferase AbiEii/AbiGii toxin family protein [candidate division WWE3 bacterium]
MHREILSENQIGLLPLITSFSLDFGLVGGTSIALHLGHRRSIDFDLFTDKGFSNEKIRKKIKREHLIQTTLIDEPDELTVVSDNVKLTFYNYPYKIVYSEQFKDVIKIPDLLTLAAMKAFALGRRAKWKDYVDIFFILQNCAFDDIINKSKEIFGSEFNERLFREQLSYYEDIDYSEKIEYMDGKQVSDHEIKQKLNGLSLE